MEARAQELLILIIAATGFCTLLMAIVKAYWLRREALLLHDQDRRINQQGEILMALLRALAERPCLLHAIDQSGACPSCSPASK